MSRFGTIGLGVVTVAAGMGLYLSSYHVAEKREAIADLQMQIEEDRDKVAKLERELVTLANLDRLEAINASVWRYGAPKPGQIVGGPVQFAAVMADQDVPEMQLAVVRNPDQATSVDQSANRNAVKSIALADRKPEVPRPLPQTEKAKPAPVMIAAAAPADLPPVAPKAVAAPKLVAAPAPVQPAASLFSEGFISEVNTAANLERAGFRKVSLQ